MKKLIYTIIAALIPAAFMLAQSGNNKRVIIHLNGDDTPYSFITNQIDSITFIEDGTEASVKITSTEIREKSAKLDFELSESEKLIYTCLRTEDTEDWSNAEFTSYLRNYGTVTEQKRAALRDLEENTEYTVVAAAYDQYNAMCTPAMHNFTTMNSADMKLTLTPEFQSIKKGERTNLQLYANGVPYEGDMEVKWEYSSPTSLVHLGDGIFMGIGYGTNIIKVSIGENYTSAEMEVIDNDMPTEYDSKYLLSPYPYLEYPTTKERIMAAEAASKSQGYILRYPENIEGDILSYKLCDFFSLGPVYIIFSNTFYDLTPEKGEPFAWGYMQGVRDEGMYGAVTILLQELGFEWVKDITLDNGTTAAWHTNEELDRSCLVYVKPYDDYPEEMYGVAEFRVLSDDPNNTNE